MRKPDASTEPAPKKPRSPDRVRGKTPRMDPKLRRQILLERATTYFADNGMAAPTRSLANACGVAQRLLYRYFPSKAALLAEIYEQAILAPFKAVWLMRLADRNISVEKRICDFYEDYYDTVLSRQWMRLFLFSGLDGNTMAPAYIDGIVKQLLEVIVREAAFARNVALPRDMARLHELGWVLHGAVSHLAIRQHVYGASQAVPVADVLALHVASFLDGLPATAGVARAQEEKLTSTTKSSVYD